MKNHINFLLALFMVGTLILSACGQATSAPQVSTSAPQVSTSAPQVSTSAPQVTKKNVTLSIMVAPEALYGDVSGNSYLFKLLSDKLGMNFNITRVDSDSAGDKLSLMVASGNLPDMMTLAVPSTSATSVLDFANQYGEKGMFVQLDKYIDAGKMPNLKAWMDKYSDIRPDVTAPDGHIYGAPQLTYLPIYRPALVMRADYLEECGIIKDRNDPAASYANISTLDDLYKAFQCLKEKNGGKPVISNRDGFANGVWKAWASFFGTSPTVYYHPQTGQYEYGPLMKRYRTAVEFMNRIYKEGILHPDFATMSDEDWSALFSSGNAPAALEWQDWGFCALKDKGINCGKDFYVQSPTIDGERILWPKPSVASIQYGYYEAISAKSSPEKIDAAVQLLDYLYGSDGSIMGWFGKEGVDWKMENGKPCQTGTFTHLEWGVGGYCGGIMPAKDAPEYTALYLQDPTFIRVTELGMLPEWAQTRAPAACPDRWTYANAQFANEGSETAAPIPVVSLNDQERATNADLGSALDTYVMEESQKFIEGQRPINDTEWADFTAKIEQLGGQKLTAVWNEALARQKK